MSVALRPLLTSLALTLTAGAVLVPAAHAGLDSGAPLAYHLLANERVEKQVQADLDGDGVRDVVIVAAKRKANGDGERTRRLLVLRGRGGAKYSEVGSGRRFLLCTTCGGAFAGTSRTPIHVSVRDGVVAVRQTSGSRVVTRQTFRFRLRADAVRLIGFDDLARDRAAGGSVSRSWNLLTGATVVRTRTPDDKVKREGGKRGTKVISLRATTGGVWPSQG